jgi:hypothetical protein
MLLLVVMMKGESIQRAIYRAFHETELLYIQCERLAQSEEVSSSSSESPLVPKPGGRDLVSGQIFPLTSRLDQPNRTNGCWIAWASLKNDCFFGFWKVALRPLVDQTWPAFEFGVAFFLLGKSIQDKI